MIFRQSILITHFQAVFCRTLHLLPCLVSYCFAFVFVFCYAQPLTKYSCAAAATRQNKDGDDHVTKRKIVIDDPLACEASVSRWQRLFDEFAEFWPRSSNSGYQRETLASQANDPLTSVTFAPELEFDTIIPVTSGETSPRSPQTAARDRILNPPQAVASAVSRISSPFLVPFCWAVSWTKKKSWFYSQDIRKGRWA